jgi:hypothetical protein
VISPTPVPRRSHAYSHTTPIRLANHSHTTRTVLSHRSWQSRRHSYITAPPLPIYIHRSEFHEHNRYAQTLKGWESRDAGVRKCGSAGVLAIIATPTHLEKIIASSASSLSAVTQENNAAYRLATTLTDPSFTPLPTNPARPFPSASSASFLRLSM